MELRHHKSHIKKNLKIELQERHFLDILDDTLNKKIGIIGDLVI